MAEADGEDRVRWNREVDAGLAGDERAQLGYRMCALRSSVGELVTPRDGGRLVAAFGKEAARFYERSPFSGDDRWSGAVNLHVERYGVDDATRQLLALAIDWPGVVGRTRFGWLFLKASRMGELRPATETEVELLLHLPDDWEAHLVERDILDFDEERAVFVAMLDPYGLRDGDDPTQPYTAERDWVRRGWFGLIKELVEDLIALGWDRELCQVKEKFGTLRFYINAADAPIRERISAAARHSAEVCELCGRGGRPRVPRHRWWRPTRCDPCWHAYLRRTTAGGEDSR